MAHPCISCGSECYCNGDIDDCIISKTPSNCESCGCEDDDYSDDDDDNDDEDEEPEYYFCIGCNWTGDHDPQTCPRCGGMCIDGVY